MRVRRSLPLAAVAIAGLLTLSACTSNNSTQPTPGPSTQSAAPIVTGDPNKYLFTTETGPGMTFGLQLEQGDRFVDQKLSAKGLLNKTYGDCGVVFLTGKIITADHLLSTVEQQTQSNNWITEYSKKVGGNPVSIVTGSLNSTEKIAGSNNTYGIQTREATYETSRYNGIVESRVFADGTGIALAFLCRTGVTVPDVLTDVKITTRTAPVAAPSPSVAPSAGVTPEVTSTPIPAPSISAG